MGNNIDHEDVLAERYGSEEMLVKATEVLRSREQSEEAFLGAQCVLLLHGLL